MTFHAEPECTECGGTGRVAGLHEVWQCCNCIAIRDRRAKQTETLDDDTLPSGAKIVTLVVPPASGSFPVVDICDAPIGLPSDLVSKLVAAMNPPAALLKAILETKRWPT